MTFKLTAILNDFEQAAHLLQEVGRLFDKLEAGSYIPAQEDVQACTQLRQTLAHSFAYTLWLVQQAERALKTRRGQGIH